MQEFFIQQENQEMKRRLYFSKKDRKVRGRQEVYATTGILLYGRKVRKHRKYFDSKIKE